MYLPALEMVCVGYKEFKLIHKEKKTNSGKAESLPTNRSNITLHIYYSQKPRGILAVGLVASSLITPSVKSNF